MTGARRKDRSLLSQDPQNIRKRIRRKNRDQAEDIALLYKPVEEWDLEELARGMPRNKNGTFVGRRPLWITPKIAAEAKRRLGEEAFSEVAVNVTKAVKVVTDLMQNEDLDEDGYPIVDNRLRLDAAKFVIEHVIGKPKQRVDVGIADSLAEMMADALTNPDGSPAHPVLEGSGEWADEEDEEPNAAD